MRITEQPPIDLSRPHLTPTKTTRRRGIQRPDPPNDRPMQLHDNRLLACRPPLYNPSNPLHVPINVHTVLFQQSQTNAEDTTSTSSAVFQVSHLRFRCMQCSFPTQSGFFLL